MKTFPLITITISAALLTACGGGGGYSGPPAPTNVSGTDVPTSATQDPEAAYSFVAGIAATKDETAEPLAVGDATLAVSDSTDPKSP